MTTWIKQIVILCFIICTVGMLSSCSDKLEDEPEGRRCIPLKRAIEIPPQYKPLQRYALTDNCTRAIPEKIEPAQEFVDCERTNSDGDIEYYKVYEQCPGFTQGRCQTEKAAGRYGRWQDLVPGENAPYTVPVIHSSYEDTLETNNVGPVRWVRKEMQNIMAPASEAMFRALSAQDGFKALLIGMLTIAIALYSINTILQLRPPSLYELMIFSFKIIFILNFALNWEVFELLVFDVLEDPIGGAGTITLLSNRATEAGMSAIANNAALSTLTGVMDQIDYTLMMLFSWNFQKLFLALFFSGAEGVFMGLVLVALMVVYLITAFNVTIAMIMAMIGRFMLYALAPIFIMCLLLNQTKQLFYNWLELLLSFTLQPIFLGAFLGLFLSVQMLIFEQLITNQTAKLICYDVYWRIMNIVDVFYMWQFADIEGKLKTPGGHAIKMSINWYFVMAAFMLQSLISGMVKWTVDLAKTMTKGMVGTMGSTIVGLSTLSEYAKIPVAGTLGGIRGLIIGNRGRNGWEGGLVRRRPITGMFRGIDKAMGAQHRMAVQTRKSEFGLRKGQE